MPPGRVRPILYVTPSQTSNEDPSQATNTEARSLQGVTAEPKQKLLEGLVWSDTVRGLDPTSTFSTSASTVAVLDSS